MAVEYRWAEGQYDRLPTLAAELVGLKVAAILAAGGPPSALAAKKSDRHDSGYFSAADDPVGLGLVESLNRPWWQRHRHEPVQTRCSGQSGSAAAPATSSAGIIAYLANPANPSAELEVKALQDGAKASGIDLQVLYASNDQKVEAAFARLTELHAGAMIVSGEPYFDSRRAAIVGLAAKYAVPASYGWRENVALGVG